MNEKEALILHALGLAGIGTEEEVCFVPLSERVPLWAGFLSVTGRGDFYAECDRYRLSVLREYADRGVRFVSFDGVVIAPDAVIGEGTLIHPGVEIRRGCTVGRGCVLSSGTVLEDSTVGDGCHINSTQIYSSVLEDGVKIGPFSHVRPGTRLRAGVKVGDFVEFKNADVGRDTKVAHLTYVGDADVGERVNFGCGTVISNYDGKKKYRTVIGSDAFIGCNTNLVAPVTVEDGAYTAAGSTITGTVPAGALAVARARQVNIPGWVERKFGGETKESKNEETKKETK